MKTSVGADSCVYQKCPFCYWYNWKKGKDLCEAISYEKSVGTDICVYQKCPFRYWYDCKTERYLSLYKFPLPSELIESSRLLL